MPTFAANLSLLFTEVPFLDRFARAAAAGFTSVECQFPYAHAAEAIAEQLTRHGLDQVLLNLPAGDWEAGERGLAVLPERRQEFRDGVEVSIAYAQTLGCRQVNGLAGLTPEGLDRTACNEVLIDNLRFAAQRLAESGIRCLVEPINSLDVPGFHLDSSAKALALIEAVGSDNLFLQLDVYHAARMGEHVAQTLERHLDRIGHIQIADCPGRHEPGTGTIDFPALFRRLDALGYRGAIGCEYLPAGRTEDGFSWLATAQRGMNTQ